MRVIVLKLRTGETVIARLVAEDRQQGTISIEKPYLVERTQIYPWLFATTQGEQVTLRWEDLLLPPMPPKETLAQTYLEASSGVAIPKPGTVPPPGGTTPPPTRGGGGVPPTRGGPLGPVQ